LERAIEVLQPFPATPDVPECVSEVEGRIPTRRSADGRVSQSLSGQRDGTGVLMRLDQPEGGVVERPWIDAAREQERLERGRYRTRGRRPRGRHRSRAAAAVDEGEDAGRDGGADESREREQRQRDRKPPPVDATVGSRRPRCGEKLAAGRVT